MSIFDGRRLPVEIFQIDEERLRRGWYSDDYFNNTRDILTELSKEGYVFRGRSDLNVDTAGLQIGDGIVEMQYFNSRARSLVVGVDEALAILQTCTGYFDEQDRFINTFDQLQVEAVHDGTFTTYHGSKMQVQPVLKVRGRYRDFAHLETAMLGAMADPSRVATNVYETLQAAGGKQVLFFPARFHHYKLQAMFGYAFDIAVKAYNARYGKSVQSLVSTQDQADWWGGQAGGTIPHAYIASFHGDSVEGMMQFCRLKPPAVKRIALVDFHNDVVGESRAVAKAMFAEYWRLKQAGEEAEAQKYVLYAVRPDTSGSLRDRSLEPLGDKRLDCGVNARLVWKLRQGMDRAYEDWELTGPALTAARAYCANVKIAVTGGFNVERIRQFEEQQIPADIYGVGSSLLRNDDDTNTDFTADISRVQVNGVWHHLSKTGRQACDNPNLKPVSTASLVR